MQSWKPLVDCTTFGFKNASGPEKLSKILIRIKSNEMDLGILYDFAHTSGRTGFGSTVILCNLFFLPDTEEELLALPKEVFDTAEEIESLHNKG